MIKKLFAQAQHLLNSPIDPIKLFRKAAFALVMTSMIPACSVHQYPRSPAYSRSDWSNDYGYNGSYYPQPYNRYPQPYYQQPIRPRRGGINWGGITILRGAPSWGGRWENGGGGWGGGHHHGGDWDHGHQHRPH